MCCLPTKYNVFQCNRLTKCCSKYNTLEHFKCVLYPLFTYIDWNLFSRNWTATQSAVRFEQINLSQKNNIIYFCEYFLTAPLISKHIIQHNSKHIQSLLPNFTSIGSLEYYINLMVSSTSMILENGQLIYLQHC